MPKSLYVDPDQMRSEGKITFQDIPMNTYKKTVKEEVEEGNFTKEDLLRIFRDMTVCREFEDMLNQIKTQARYADVETTYPGPAHLSRIKMIDQLHGVFQDEQRIGGIQCITAVHVCRR